MAGADGFLIHPSAVGRMMRPDVIGAWREQISAGRIGICEVTRLELLRSARSPQEFDGMLAGLEAVYTWWEVPEGLFGRALEAQQRLARAGSLHRADLGSLLLAAVAAHHGLTVLHYDPDVDALGPAAGQPTRWLAEPGSIP